MQLSKKLRYLKVILGAIIITLLATNPSRSEFASYLHIPSTTYIGRDKNYFVCSIYSIAFDKKARYLGILGNFYSLD